MNSFKNTFFLKKKFQNIFDTIVKLEDLFFKDKDINLKTPIFITGMPRSGTTLVTHILHDTKNMDLFFIKIILFPNYHYFGINLMICIIKVLKIKKEYTMMTC